MTKSVKDPTVHIGLGAYGESTAATTHKYLISPKSTGKENLSGSSFNRGVEAIMTLIITPEYSTMNSVVYAVLLTGQLSNELCP
jgi:hypothetical protein